MHLPKHMYTEIVQIYCKPWTGLPPVAVYLQSNSPGDKDMNFFFFLYSSTITSGNSLSLKGPFKDYLVQILCNELGHIQLEQIIKNLIDPDLEYLQEWEYKNCSINNGIIL